jgi:hypothetical protein
MLESRARSLYLCIDVIYSHVALRARVFTYAAIYDLSLRLVYCVSSVFQRTLGDYLVCIFNYESNVNVRDFRARYIDSRIVARARARGRCFFPSRTNHDPN